MKAVILAGGLGTRLSEETGIRPKPMVEIGGKPILWHIMKTYSYYGINDFVICGGYKVEFIKDWFVNYFKNQGHIQVSKRGVLQLGSEAEDWNISIVNTGEDAQTGDRILAIQDYVYTETFFLTYGDGVANINIDAELAIHREHNKILTMMVSKPSSQFGMMKLDEFDNVVKFEEKPEEESYINAGYFICEPAIFTQIKRGNFEKGALPELVKAKQVKAYKHSGFWKPMDTLKDKMDLEAMWQSGNAPWKVW
jgi:glucose-1-phosphate cytidylyltransferase